VDFTSYAASSSSAAPRSSAGTAYPSLTTDSRFSRKRTLSAAERQPPGTTQALEDRNNRPPTTSHHHASSAGRSSTVADPAIDPSLSSFPARLVSPSLPVNGGAPADETKEERRARLLAQRDAMRQYLEATERDLEQMEEEEG